MAATHHDTRPASLTYAGRTLIGWTGDKTAQPHHVQRNAPRQNIFNLADGLQLRRDLGAKCREGFRAVEFHDALRQQSMLDGIEPRARAIFWPGGQGGVFLIGGDFGGGGHGIISDCSWTACFLATIRFLLGQRW